MSAAAAIGAVVVLAPATALALPPEGGLTQLAPPNDCIFDNPPVPSGCGTANAVGLDSIEDLVISPDGRHVYTVAQSPGGDDAVAALSVNSAGGLTQLADPNECISDDPDGGGAMPPTDPACQSGVGLAETRAIAISPDGLSVYTVSPDNSDGDSAVAVFSRNPVSGALTQLPDPYECLSDDIDGPGGVINGPEDPACGSAVGIADASDVAVSPDGENVYVTSIVGVVAAFTRDTDAAGAPLGSLTQLPGADACIADGMDSTSCDAVPGHAIATGIQQPRGIDVSEDGNHVYVASSGSATAVAAFARNPDGSLDQLANPNDCLSDDPDGPAGNPPADDDCGGVFGLGGARGIEVAPDDDAVYVASSTSDSVAEFARNESTGVLTQLADPNDCLSFDDDFIGPLAVNGPNIPTDANCGSATGLDSVSALAAALDNKSVYSVGTQGGVAAFSRNQSTEQLNQLNEPFDCLGTAEPNCAAATAISSPSAVVVSPSGAHVYVALSGFAGVAAFSRELSPACTGAAVTVTLNTPTPIATTCTDPNGDPIDREILLLPANGVLSGDPDSGFVTYTPNPGYLGADSFRFNAQDLPAPSQVSNLALVDITVVPPPPTTSPPGPGATSPPRKRCRKGRKLVKRKGKQRCVKRKKRR